MAHLIAGTSPLGIGTRSVQTCAFCDGTGSHRGLRCFVCSGSGSLAVKNPPAKCSGCQGSGTRHREIICPDCFGTGWHAASKI